MLSASKFSIGLFNELLEYDTEDKDASPGAKEEGVVDKKANWAMIELSVVPKHSREELRVILRCSFDAKFDQAEGTESVPGSGQFDCEIDIPTE